MVACLYNGCSGTPGDQQAHGCPTTPLYQQAIQKESPLYQTMQNQHRNIFEPAINSPEAHQQQQQSSAASTVSPGPGSDNFAKSKDMSSACSTSGASSSGGTSSTGRRHGKRQKGQPYIPSYMDLSTGPEPCVVCGDAATGYHYRAMTCEGCKGFFRRTIQKSLKYDCKFGGGCSVDKRTRNQCQQCRYTRCLTVGMAADLVLNEGERLAKRRLIEQNRQKRQQQPGPEKMVSGQSKSSSSPEFKSKDDAEESNLNSEEKQLIDSVVNSYNNALSQLGQQLKRPDGDKKSWRQLTEMLSPAIVKVVEFAKSVPGFAELDNADQVLLLRSGCIEVLCLRVASKPLFRSKLAAKRNESSPDDFNALIEPIIEFSNGISKLQLDTTETALLAAVLLMQSDRSGLKQPERVESCLDKILAAYRNYVSQRRPQQPFDWAKILMKVTDVRAISLKYSEKVLNVNVDDSPAPELPGLVLEMLYDNSDISNEAESDLDASSLNSDDDHVTSYASSARSPVATSDLPSSPLSITSSSSSGSGRPAPHVLEWNAQPTSPIESLASSSSGSGRSAASPSRPVENQQPILTQDVEAQQKQSTVALQQLASIALDPLFYQRQLLALMGSNSATPANQQQLIAAAAAAAFANQASQLQQNQTTKPTSDVKANSLSKYSISSLIA